MNTDPDTKKAHPEPQDWWKVEERSARGRCLVATRQLEVNLTRVAFVKYAGLLFLFTTAAVVVRPQPINLEPKVQKHRFSDTDKLYALPICYNDWMHGCNNNNRYTLRSLLQIF